MHASSPGPSEGSVPTAVPATAVGAPESARRPGPPWSVPAGLSVPTGLSVPAAGIGLGGSGLGASWSRSTQRAGLLVGAYATMWLLGHGCCATYLQSGDDAPGSSPAAFLWVGLLLSQLGGCFMWHSLTAAGILIRHLLGVAGLAIASPLLSQTLTGTPQQWWHGLIVLSLVAQAAWWAIQQPIGQPPTPRSPTRYSLFQWLIFSGWLALALSLARDWQGTTAELAAVILCFGGLSLLVAVHRFAYLQLFWPASEVLPGRRPSPSVRMWDRIGILAILAVIQFAVAWGLGHYYGDDPRGSWVWAMCLLAGLWPAVDVAFEKLVRVNATLNATGPSVLSQASVLPGPAAAANNC